MPEGGSTIRAWNSLLYLIKSPLVFSITIPMAGPNTTVRVSSSSVPCEVKDQAVCISSTMREGNRVSVSVSGFECQSLAPAATPMIVVASPHLFCIV